MKGKALALMVVTGVVSGLPGCAGAESPRPDETAAADTGSGIRASLLTGGARSGLRHRLRTAGTGLSTDPYFDRTWQLRGIEKTTF